MDVMEFIAVVSLVLATFALGYALGKDHRKQK